jgi:hypothetical protein
MLVREKCDQEMIRIADQEMGFAINPKNGVFADTEQEGQDLEALYAEVQRVKETCRCWTPSNKEGVSCYTELGKGNIIIVEDQGYVGIFYNNYLFI